MAKLTAEELRELRRRKTIPDYTGPSKRLPKDATPEERRDWLWEGAKKRPLYSDSDWRKKSK